MFLLFTRPQFSSKKYSISYTEIGIDIFREYREVMPIIFLLQLGGAQDDYSFPFPCIPVRTIEHHSRIFPGNLFAPKQTMTLTSLQRFDGAPCHNNISLASDHKEALLFF